MSHFHQGRNVDDEGAADLIPVGEEDYAQSDDTPAGYESDGRLTATRDGVPGKPNAEWRALLQQSYMDISGSGNLLLSDLRLRRGISGLTAAPIKEVAFTYEKGERLGVYDDKATCIDVAIHYITGADFAEVIRQENEGVMRGAPVKKSPTWKAATAGDLLKEIEATEELEFDFKDMTPHILQIHRNRQSKHATNNGTESNSKVNIKSELVHIVNADSPKKQFDLECLCIELHGNSLMNLIYNFRTLLLEKGTKARRNPLEIIQILETMVEDARRLLSWSPIIGRIAHRLAIQQSTYTRYGCDNGKAFWTLATSRGIALTVKHSVSYLSELKASNSKQAFGLIKPKVMQIVVLLLSLLNDSDLKQLENMLEDQYQLKADRKSMELTIMKVLTLSSVGAPLFLSSLLSSFSGERCDTQNFKEESQRVIAWDSFVSAITREGWILPGSFIKKRLKYDKTPKPKKQSWKVKWDEYTDTEIFDHLQYNGEKKEVNDIPPLKLQSKDFEMEEVLADFQDGKKYVVAFKDLEGITLASPGTYQLSDAESGEKKDLRVDTEDQFFELKDLWNAIRRLCVSVSEHAPRGEMQRSGKVGNTLTRVKRSILVGRARHPQAPPTLPRIAGRRAKNTTTIETSASGQCKEIAVCWFLEGGKITKAEMLEGVLEDWNTLEKTVKELRRFSVSTRGKVTPGKDRVKGSHAAAEETKLLEMLDRELDRIEQELLKINEKRRQLSQVLTKENDDPIARVHFPNPVHYKQDMPWLCFHMNLDREGAGLEVRADLYTICGQPSWTANTAQVSIEDQHPKKKKGTLGVVPLDPVPEPQRTYEIRVGAEVLLLGGLVVVMKPKGRVVNYLKLTSLDITMDDDEWGRSEDEAEDEKSNPMMKLL